MHLLDRDKIQERYNYYVQYYNKLKNPITASAELITVKEGLQKRLEELKEDIDLYIDDITFYLGEVYDSTFSTEGSKAEKFSATNHNDLIENIVNHIKWEVHKFFHISRSEDFINYNSQQIKEVYNAYSQNAQEKKSIEALKVIVRNGEKYKQTYYHLRGIQGVINRIIDEDYPNGLINYFDLNEQEKKEILDDRTLGAPQNEEVPQGKIEEIVKECIKDKSNKRFIHQSGRYKGKANRNQIFEYIKLNYPRMVNDTGTHSTKGVTRRTIFRRIVKALPDDMT